MHAHSESEIRKSFINCSKGAAQRINIPHEVAQAEWDQLIFLSWIDPKSPRTGYVVAETENGLRGLVLEKNPHKGKGGARMCQICLTLHPGSGVSMVSIQRTKSAKDHYNTVGTYLCSDLACNDYTLGRKKPSSFGAGNGISNPVTRSTGAAKEWKQRSCTRAVISEATEANPGASEMTTARPVLATEAVIVSSSSGFTVRRSTTSTESPSSAAAWAAARQVGTEGP